MGSNKPLLPSHHLYCTAVVCNLMVVGVLCSVPSHQLGGCLGWWVHARASKTRSGVHRGMHRGRVNGTPRVAHRESPNRRPPPSAGNFRGCSLSVSVCPSFCTPSETDLAPNIYRPTVCVAPPWCATLSWWVSSQSTCPLA